jgi:ribosomal protein S18 acetylase RimI-like enzyme
MAEDVTVRRMIPSDLPRVNEIDRVLFGEARLPTFPFSFEAYWAEYRPDIRIVIEVAGQVAGFIVGSVVVEEHSSSILSLRHAADRPPRYSQVGWIDMVGVHPGYQHSGIGRRLVDAFCEECKRLNIGVRGVAAENDVGLRRFLGQAGFTSGEMVVYEKRP